MATFREFPHQGGSDSFGPDKKAPPFVAPYFEIMECSGRIGYLAETFSMNELFAAIQLTNNSSPGLDGIKFIHLKQLSTSSRFFNLNLFNEFFKTGCCPLAWIATKVVSLLKPGREPNDPNSYRPISLLSCLRKLYEKMICTRLDHWAERFDVISKS
jgi:hypothetical protein